MNSKKTRKLSLAILTAYILCTISCGSEGSPEETTSDTQTATEPVETSLLDELGEKNFEGREYVLYDGNPYSTLHINFPGDEANGEIVNDALIDRNRTIAERYNVTFRYHSETGTDAVMNSVLAGDKEYDLFFQLFSSSIRSRHLMCSPTSIRSVNSLTRLNGGVR